MVLRLFPAGSGAESAEEIDMHCGVMVTGYNQGEQMDNTLYLGELVEPLGFDSI